MDGKRIQECNPVDISDEDVLEAMKSLQGYIDITPGDFREVYRVAYALAMDRMMTSIKAKDIMTQPVHSLRADMDLIETVDLLAVHRISGAPVVDHLGRIIGVVSEKDIMKKMGDNRAGSFMEIIALCLKNKGCLAVPMRQRTVSDIMTSPAITIIPDMPIGDILAIISEKQINRLPVIGNDGKPIGIVARSDLVRAYCAWI